MCLKYKYDPAGNRSKKDAPTAATYYTWDPKDRLRWAEPVGGRVTFATDGDGRRVLKQTPSDTTRFVWDLDRVLQETDGSGTTEEQYLTTDDQFGNLVSAYGGGATAYYQPDALGSTEATELGAGLSISFVVPSNDESVR